jgi:hypothetical protein
METLKEVIDYYQTKERYDIRNIYVFGSALHRKTESSVPPNDIDLVMVVASVSLSRADKDFFKKRGWLPPTFMGTVPTHKSSRKGVEGI